MKIWTTKKSTAGLIWSLVRLALVVCTFFWFGLYAGLIAVLLSIDIK